MTVGVCGRASDVSLVLTPTKVEENLAHTAVLDTSAIETVTGGFTLSSCFRNGDCLFSWSHKATEGALRSRDLAFLTLHLPGIARRLYPVFRKLDVQRQFNYLPLSCSSS